MSHLKFRGGVLFLLVVSAVADGVNINYGTPELEAMQVIWGEWNKSTPNLGSNLAGWDANQIYPCVEATTVQRPNWRGVECIWAACNDTDCHGYIIGMSLHNASIVGVLPPAIGNISLLSTLELTGNPNLGGRLPQEIQYCFLHTLDLHDNALNGTLPDLPYLITMLNLDLSGNRFVGEFYSQIQTWTYLQTLNLARNHFSGSMPTDAFVNMTQLISLDLSSNNLTGPLPNLTTCPGLQSLILSNNSFSGSLPDLKILSNLYFLGSLFLKVDPMRSRK